MPLRNSINSLRCTLCRNGLLDDYDVYTTQTGQFGVPGEPVLYARTNGYFYAKNQRHFAEVIEIAGDLAEKNRHNNRMIVFDDTAQPGNLVLVGGTFYRVDNIRVIMEPCRILELEVYHFAAAN